jgi:HAD superfamily hydrolase (TIGR01484 family)
LDLDGTLIGSSGDVRDSVWKTIEPLRDVVGLSVCTGRPGAGVARRVAEQLSPSGLHIFNNGGLIARGTGEAVHATSLGRDDLEALVERSRSVDAVLELYTPSGIFVSKNNEDCREHANAIDIEVAEADLGQIIARYEVVKAHWIGREPTFAEALEIELTDAEVGVASSPVLPEFVFASITRRGASKGTAAAEVARLVGTTLERCAAVGDAEGDLPLLEVVGHPYVVANATEELRQTYETLGHVDAEGIEPLLRRLAVTA